MQAAAVENLNNKKLNNNQLMQTEIQKIVISNLEKMIMIPGGRFLMGYYHAHHYKEQWNGIQ